MKIEKKLTFWANDHLSENPDWPIKWEKSSVLSRQGRRKVTIFGPTWQWPKPIYNRKKHNFMWSNFMWTIRSLSGKLLARPRSGWSGGSAAYARAEARTQGLFSEPPQI